MTLRLPRVNKQRGFSLIELLVAIGISSLMMLLIGRIVGETQQAVSRGVELGEAISLSRTISGQLQADADAMYGPHGIGQGTRGPTIDGADLDYAPSTSAPSLPDRREGVSRSPDVETGGVLVITKHAYIDQPFSPQANLLDASGDPVTTRFVFSDQLAFIRERLDEKAKTPASDRSYLAATDLRAAPFERVWYGHVSKTASDGSYVPPVAGDPTRNGEPEPMLWLLGRHATLLFDEPENLDRSTASPAGLRIPEELPPVHALGVRAGAPVQNTTAPPPDVPLVLRSALTDSAFWGLSEPSAGYGRPGDPRTTPPQPGKIHRHGTVVGGYRPNYVLPGGSGGSLAAAGDGDRLWSSLGFEEYRLRAIEQLAFVSPIRQSNRLAGRLSANPYPTGPGYEPWQIAQAHPILAEGCSDFVVEFAADTDGDGEVDTVSRQESENAFGTGDTRAEGEIKWYTDDASFNSRGSTGTPRAQALVPGQPLTFPLPSQTGPLASDYPGNSKQEQFRNQVYQPASGALLSNNLRDYTNAFVWRHDAFNPDLDAADRNDRFYCNWPYLLRVRYRLHDGAGRLAGADSLQGIWFEQVLRVDRPYP